jgi:ZIP family zinc transporter
LSVASPILIGVIASLLAGLGTALGAVPALAFRRISDETQDVLLGFAAGVMLSASYFSLIVPGLAAAEAQGAGRIGAALVVTAGILIGAACMWLANRIAPHEHFIVGREGPEAVRMRRVWLFVIAITIHNFPEGLAVGVGFGGGDIGNGTALAIAIGLQNMPEGLAVAVALLTLNYTRTQAFLVAALTGLVEPLGGALGIGTVTLAQALLPWGLAFAAGAMLFVISDEIIPETHRKGLEMYGTVGLMIGVVVMMILDVAFG